MSLNLTNERYTSFSQFWERRSDVYGRTGDGLLLAHGEPRTFAL